MITSHELAKKLLELPDLPVTYKEIINQPEFTTSLQAIENSYWPAKICNNTIGPEGMGTLDIRLVFSN